MHKPGLLLASACLLLSSTSWASSNFCEEPNCGNRPFGKSSVAYKRAPAARLSAKSSSASGERLSGQIDGNWDDVRGLLTFPWTSDQGQALQLLALSLPGEAENGITYSAGGWHRELFFLDLGDGVPRLLSAYLIDPAFQPGPQDPLAESGQLWLSQYLLYQEAEELAADSDFYTGYQEGAAIADLRFVCDEQGQVLQMVVDIYDDGGHYLYSVNPQLGDRINPSFIGYDLDQADILYALFYFNEPRRMDQQPKLQRRYYAPNGRTDNALPADFDAADLRLSFMLEAYAAGNGEERFGYSQPKSLEYDWGDAQTRSSGSGPASEWLLLTALSLLLWRRTRNDKTR